MYLLALDTSPNVEPVDQLLQNGGKRSHTNTTTNKDSHIISEPVLVALSKRSIKVQFGVGLAPEVGWVVVLSEVVRPGTNSSDVQRNMLLMWGRADGEGMELSRVLS